MVDKIRYATPQQLFASGKDFVFANNHRGFLAKCNSTETIYIYIVSHYVHYRQYIYRERGYKAAHYNNAIFVTESQKL